MGRGGGKNSDSVVSVLNQLGSFARKAVTKMCAPSTGHDGSCASLLSRCAHGTRPLPCLIVARSKNQLDFCDGGDGGQPLGK